MDLDPKYAKVRWWREALGARSAVLRARLTFRSPYVYEDKVLEGERFRFYIADAAAESWYGKRSDRNCLEMRFVRDELLTPGSTVLECGAHHGHDTIVLSRWVGPTGRVFAFEPLAENADVIRKNLELNGITNAEVITAAVGASTGSVAMASNGNSHVVGDGAGGVALTSIDAFCAERGVVPDLIKIDVEGFEWEVLKGARETIARHHPMLQIEVHGDQLFRYGTSANELWSLVDAAECDVWLQPDDLSYPEPSHAGVALAGRQHVYLRWKQRHAARAALDS